MLMPVQGTITAKFNQMRPLKGRTEENEHIHGAVDIAAPSGRTITAPEAGLLRGYIARRAPNNGSQYWDDPIVMPHHAYVNRVFPFSNYFYDMFGGVLVLRAGERTHIFTHVFGRQMFNYGIFTEYPKYWHEEKGKLRWPIFAIYTPEVPVGVGQAIGKVGDAGYSSGPHVHWEIHNGYRWNKHLERINPESLLA